LSNKNHAETGVLSCQKYSPAPEKVVSLKAAQYAMKVTLLAIGKTNEAWLQEGMRTYEQRMKHYCPFQYTETEDVKVKAKKPDATLIKKEEALRAAKYIQPTDHLLLLDETGTHYSSEEFGELFGRLRNAGTKNLVFLIGGPYGFDQQLIDRAQGKVSLSKMTFPHRLVRIFASEQIYRAHTILKGEPYHHV